MKLRNAKKIQLPTNFAQQLLQCEIQYKLSDTPSKQTVKSLIELYTAGVQYYESIRSHKYLYFQLKMNQVFTSAATLNAINQQKQKAVQQVQSPLKKKLKSGHQQDKIQALQIKHKQQKMFQQVAENTSQTATVNTVKKMINQNDLKSIQKKQKVKKQMQSQDAIFQEKLKKRKSRLLFSKSFSSAGIMGQADTQDTLFTQVSNPTLNLKPIQVSFSNVINQNQSDDDDIDKIQKGRQRRISISQDSTKKSRVQIQDNNKNTNKEQNEQLSQKNILY